MKIVTRKGRHKVRSKDTALMICFVLLILVESGYATDQVVIEFLYWDLSAESNMCWSCPAWLSAYRDFQEKSRVLDNIEALYGDSVLIERIDMVTPEGRNRTRQYAPIAPQSLVVNHEIKIEGDAFTEEHLRTVIDDYLTKGEPAEEPLKSLTVLGAFSLGLFETVSPCLLALLSFVLSYTVGEADHFAEGVLRTITVGIGFVSAAILLGATVALILVYVPSLQTALTWMVAVVAVVFGLVLLGLPGIPVQTKPIVTRLAGKYAATYVGLLLLGFIFYFLDPCVAPLAFTTLMMLQRSEFVFPLLMFCLGAILPFIAIGLLAGYASKLTRSTYKHKSKLRAFSGLILIIYALYVILFHLL